jgi:hypothetical protein
MSLETNVAAAWLRDQVSSQVRPKGATIGKVSSFIEL